jgi:hypothetical protein
VVVCELGWRAIETGSERGSGGRGPQKERGSGGVTPRKGPRKMSQRGWIQSRQVEWHAYVDSIGVAVVVMTGGMCTAIKLPRVLIGA